MATNTTDAVEILRALADETRLSIVRKVISEGSPTKSCDILACASVHKLSQPAMSHHFAKLVDAGVLKEYRHGVEKAYAVDRELLQSIGIDSTKL